MNSYEPLTENIYILRHTSLRDTNNQNYEFNIVRFHLNFCIYVNHK